MISSPETMSYEGQSQQTGAQAADPLRFLAILASRVLCGEATNLVDNHGEDARLVDRGV